MPSVPSILFLGFLMTGLSCAASLSTTPGRPGLSTTPSRPPSTTTRGISTTPSATPTSSQPAPTTDSNGCLDGAIVTVSAQKYVQICGRDYQGGDIGIGAAGVGRDYQGCFGLCATQSGCVGFVYGSQNSACFLKSAINTATYNPALDGGLLLAPPTSSPAASTARRQRY